LPDKARSAAFGPGRELVERFHHRHGQPHRDYGVSAFASRPSLSLGRDFWDSYHCVLPYC
jgi:hypothetical protein